MSKRLRLSQQMVVGGPISALTLPALAEVQTDKTSLHRTSIRALKVISCICAPIFFGSSSVANEIVPVLFGQKWMHVAPVFSVLSIGGFFAIIQSFCDSVLTLKDRQYWSFYPLVTYTTLAVLAFLLLRGAGINYVAIPFLLPYIIVFPLSLFLASRAIGISPFPLLTAILPSLVSAALMFFVLRFIVAMLPFDGNFLRLTALIGLGAVLYVAIMSLIDLESLLFVGSVLKRLGSRTLLRR